MQVTMRSSPKRPRAGALAALVPLCAALIGIHVHSRASAAEDACDGAYVAAQKAEKGGKLVEALAAYRACASAACGVNMGNACNKKSLALAEQVPSVVVVAREGGVPLPRVTVTMDGAPIAADGTAVSVNPGAHTFVFVTPDARTTTVETVVVEGKKAQEVSARFEPVAPKPDSGAGAGERPPPRVAGAEPASGGGRQRTVGVFLAGGGLVLAGVGGIVGLTAKSKYDASNESNCDAASNRCNAAGLAQRDSAVGLGTTATVLVVVGGVAALGGAVLWLTGPRGGAQSTGVTAVGMSPTGLVLGGAF